MMTSRQIVHLLRTSLGLLEMGWQAVSAHTKDESFTIIRYDSRLKKGAIRRMHAKIEDLLSEELGAGDRL
tara:strand:- start:7463 stop:7672 length:210 start_codon:yes stop_codon:yes gene_type:complete